MQVAMSLRRAIRTVDVAARLGGDEFCVLAPEQDARRRGKLGERLAAAVEGRWPRPTTRRSASRSAWLPAPSTAGGRAC